MSNPGKVPSGEKRILAFALDLIEQCRASSGVRAAYCRQINALVETGRADGTRSLFNLLYGHLDRLAAHLFSPTDLRFSIDFVNQYDKNTLERGKTAARILSRDFENSNTDMEFAQGVFEAVKYGVSILKQWVTLEGTDQFPVYHKRLVMPWQFGLYNESECDLSKQYAMCETTMLTLPEVWRRIYSLPEADKLFARIKSNAASGQADDNSSFFHQILSTSTLNTGLDAATRPMPGGIVQLGNDPNYAIMGPDVAVDMVRMHELWVQDENDYCTIQVIEPDILVAPRYQKTNALIPGKVHSQLHPYTPIQCNRVSGYFWGRPEIADLIEPQALVSQWAEDIRRLMNLQIDKILGFSGFDGLTDETYDQFRSAGYFNGNPGATINDLTPKFPPEAIPVLKLYLELMDKISGFPSLMQGEGSSGVRSGAHAGTLLKTGSPRLRDRALLIERQCAQAGDLLLALMQAKDPRNYWADGKTLETVEKSTFLLADLPDDRRVTVDSHSSSPIFMDDHAQLIAFGVKAGFLDGEDAINNLPFPNKEMLITKFRERQEKKTAEMQALMKANPEMAEKMMLRQGGRR